MSEYSPVSIPYTSDSVELASKKDVATIANSRGFIGLGVDAGGVARFLRVDTAGKTALAAEGTAGTPSAAVLSVQGVSGGTAIPITLTDGVDTANVTPAATAALPSDKALVAPSPNTIGLVELSGSNISAFGDPIAVPMMPLFQFDFVGQLITAGTMTQQGGAYITNTGTATTNGGRLKLSTGTNAAGSATFISYKIARYRAGQGMLARFTYVFQAGVANNIQVAGMCAPTLTWTNNATAPGAPITAVTVGDGYFFGFNGTSFGIRHKNSRGNGGAGLDTWTAKTSWNRDQCDGSNSAFNPSGFNLNPLLGNVYMIKYPYLGYGDILFYVMDSRTGRWILVHVIEYANSVVETQLQNPGLNFFAQVINSGSTTDVSLYVGSVGVFLTGERAFTGPQFGVDARLANNGAATELPVLSLRCCTSINGEPNRGMMRLRSLSFSGDGANTDLRVTIRRNATLTGSTFLNAVRGTITASSAGFILTNAQSMATFDTAATAIAAAGAGASDTIFNAVAARSTGYQIDLAAYDIFVVPGDTLTFAARSTITANSVQVAVNWQEDI